MERQALQRVAIVDATGSGKTSLARALVRRLAEDALRSRESLFLWALQSHPRQRREYPLQLAQPEYGHLQQIHLRRPRQTEQWLRSLG